MEKDKAKVEERKAERARQATVVAQEKNRIDNEAAAARMELQRSKVKAAKARKEKKKSDDLRRLVELDGEFRQQILNEGWSVNIMAGDGNCLFSSVGDQLYQDNGDSYAHSELRELVVKRLLEYPRDYCGFFPGNTEREQLIAMKEHVNQIRCMYHIVFIFVY